MPSVERLLESMRRSKSGWSSDDLEKLYLGLGFEFREGGKHRVYIHPKFPELRATVTRSRSLAKGYIDHALDIAKRLEELEAKHGKQG